MPVLPASEALGRENHSNAILHIKLLASLRSTSGTIQEGDLLSGVVQLFQWGLEMALKAQRKYIREFSTVNLGKGQGVLPN